MSLHCGRVRLLAHLTLAATIGCALFAANGASAQVFNLADLIANNGTITNGDKVFSNFAYLATGDMPLAAGVNVVPITVAGNLGIQFQGGFTDLPGGGSSDALITYVVTSLQGATITDAHIDGNPDVVGGTGALSITESFTPDAPNTMSIFDIEPGATQVSDSTIFATPHSSLHVQKDILGVAGDGIATLSFVNQTYSQVPEPGSMALLMGLGVTGTTFAYARLRRRKK